MSGARSNALIKSLAGRLPRTRENAAIVPITALVTVVINAIWSENKVASTQPGSEKKASYHRNENPLGGKRKNVVALNDIGDDKQRRQDQEGEDRAGDAVERERPEPPTASCQSLATTRSRLRRRLNTTVMPSDMARRTKEMAPAKGQLSRSIAC